MPTRNVVLTEQQEAFVGSLIAAGRYQNASEVLREGLRLLEDHMQLHHAQLASIQAGILEGLDQIDAGRLAKGSGEAAIERAFSRAVKKRGK